jgi:hypothetical protein
MSVPREKKYRHSSVQSTLLSRPSNQVLQLAYITTQWIALLIVEVQTVASPPLCSHGFEMPPQTSRVQHKMHAFEIKYSRKYLD